MIGGWFHAVRLLQATLDTRRFAVGATCYEQCTSESEAVIGSGHKRSGHKIRGQASTLSTLQYFQSRFSVRLINWLWQAGRLRGGMPPGPYRPGRSELGLRRTPAWRSGSGGTPD